MKIRLDCHHAHRLAVESMDRPLSWRERIRLRLHLRVCDMCASFVRQMAVMRRSARRWGDEDEQRR